tara:strand:- start:266 stop:1537 length:1272 start_codon:yes stop_codon:yes gene_type:complete
MLSLSNSTSSASYISFSSTRSLVLDGGNDYIDTNDTFKTTFDGAYSISLWIKPDDGQPSPLEYLFGSQNSSGEDRIIGMLMTDGKIRFDFKSNNDATYEETDAAVFSDGAGAWTHLVFTTTLTGSGDTELKIYVNGAKVDSTANASVTEANHANFDTDITFRIGDLNNNGSVAGPFAGGVDEFAIWSSTLSDAAILALYNDGNPTELSSAKGNYAAQASLVAWYRMGDGFLDDIGDNLNNVGQGIITNQVGLSIGDNLATGTNSTFDSATGMDWERYDGGSGTTSVAVSGGVLVVTQSAAGNNDNSGAKITSANLSGSGVESGKIYKMSADIWLGTGVASDYRFFAGGASNIIALTTTKTNHVCYFKTVNTNSVLIFNNDVDSDDGTFFVDNFSLQEITPTNGQGIMFGGISSFSSDFSNSFN